MSNKKSDFLEWRPLRDRIRDRKGVFGYLLSEFDEWYPGKIIGRVKSFKKQKKEGQGSETQKPEGVFLDWDELPADVHNFIVKQAEKTGNTIEDVLASKPIKNYILSRLGGEKGK